MRLSILLAVPFLAATVAACQQSETPKADQPAAQATTEESALSPSSVGATDRSHAGEAAPDLELEQNASGETTTIAAIAAANPGKKILVNLWATWCAPCLKELPTLDKLQSEAKDALLVVPVSQDLQGWSVVTEAFTPELYPHLATLVESKMAFGTQLKATGLPLTILYDDKAQEVWRLAGDFDWASPEARAMIGL